MSPLRIIFAGSGEFGVPTLRSLIDAPNVTIVQVVSQPDRPAGRGRQLHPTAVSQLAIDRGLPLLRTETLNTQTLPKADLLLVIAFGQKIAPHIVDHPRLGSVNLHASLLPKYRGAAPINWSIVHGERITGNSVIRLAEKMDAGAILAQSRVEIGELETAGELHDRLALDGVELIARVLNDLAHGTSVESTQDESHVTLAPKLSRERAVIDWANDASAIADHIRGMYPWPGCRMRLHDSRGSETARVTLVRARSHASDGARFGEILMNQCVGASGGGVEVIELQPEGKRPMSLDAFRNGHRWEPGMRLESIA